MRGRGIEIARIDLILVSICLMEERVKNNSQIVELRGIENLLGIKWSTLLKYLGSLRKHDLIETISRVPYRVKITKKGLKISKKQLNKLKNLTLKKEDYKLDKDTKLGYLISNLRSPEDLISVLSEMQRRSGFDLITYIALRTGLKDGSMFMKTRNELDEELSSSEGMLSVKSQDLENVSNLPSFHPLDRILVESDMLRRQGRIEEAITNYQLVLDKVDDLGNGRGAMSEIGMIQCIRYKDGHEKAMERIETTLKKVKSNNLKGMLKRLKADILSDEGKFQEAMVQYKSAKGHFHFSHAQNLLAICLNNIAVLYFRKDDLIQAERTWKKALLISKRNDIPCAKAVILVNLADVDGRNGRIRPAYRKLREARNLFKAMGDLEGLSAVDFNQALIKVEENDREASLRFFDRAMRFPLRYHPKRIERWKVMNERFREKGWDLPNHIKSPP